MKENLPFLMQTLVWLYKRDLAVLLYALNPGNRDNRRSQVMRKMFALAKSTGFGRS